MPALLKPLHEAAETSEKTALRLRLLRLIGCSLRGLHRRSTASQEAAEPAAHWRLVSGHDRFEIVASPDCTFAFKEWF